MRGPYLENHELQKLNDLLQHAADDTVSCWIATRINGASASMACDGNISTVLLDCLDRKLLKHIGHTKDTQCPTD